MRLKEKLFRGHFIYFFLYWLYEIYMDRRIGGIRLNKMLRSEYEGLGIFPVQSTNYRMLDQIIDFIYLTPQDVFVDVGCGWGRMISYLMIKKRECKYIGVEINSEAAEVARKRFEAYSKVQIITANITEYIPKNVTVFFLSNPFNANILSRFLEKISSEINHPVRLIYLHAVYQDMLECRQDNWCIELNHIIRPKHHIPVKFSIFKYTP